MTALRAKEQNGRRHQLADELHALARPVAEIEDAKAGFDIARQLLFPAALHLRLDGEAFRVSMPVMLSTRKDWFSAPRLNFSSSRVRKTGVTSTEIPI